MQEKSSTPNFLEIPQQDLQEMLHESVEKDPDLQHALDRSCTPHCVEAIAELEGVHIASLDRLDEYLAFLRQHGPHPEAGSNNQEMYSVDDGWYNIAIADLLRWNGYNVVSQGLQYDQATSNTDAAQKVGRIRTKQEVEMLNTLSAYGGERNPRWLDAVAETLSQGGYVIASIKIPSSKRPGAWGQHSVVVTSLGPDGVQYFDPDKLALERYGETAAAQEISRTDESKLMYNQAPENFLNRMTGEVMHVFRPQAS